MSDSTRLTALLATHLSKPAAALVKREAGLEESFARWIAEARQAWPGTEIPVDEFVSYVAGRLVQHDDPIRGLRSFDWPEVYLACACSRGHTGALRAFEEHYVAVVPAAIAHVKLSASDVDEVMQFIKDAGHIGPASFTAEYVHLFGFQSQDWTGRWWESLEWSLLKSWRLGE